MALLQMNFKSDVLQLTVPLNIIYPDSLYSETKTTAPLPRLVYVLHGTGQDCYDWLRYTSIERYAEERNLILILPSCARSAYADQKAGYPYWTYLTEELPRICGKIFHIPLDRERTFAAGLSMGGYGALKWGLRYPDMFKGIIALSSGLDRVGLCTLDNKKTISHATEEEIENYRKSGRFPFGEKVFYEFEDNWGDIGTFYAEKNDIFTLIRDVPSEEKENLPGLYIAVGTEDPNYNDHCRLRLLLDERNIEYTYEEESGAHEWWFWDKYIEKAFDWLCRL